MNENMVENHVDHNMNHGNNDNTPHAMGHSMAFNNRLPFTVLYSGWEVTDSGSLAWTCVVVAMLTISFEAIKGVRGYLSAYQRRQQLWGYTEKLLNKCHFLDTFIYLIQVFLAYHIMLAVMTFNSWVFGSVMLAFTLGHLFLAPLGQNSAQNPAEVETCCT